MLSRFVGAALVLFIGGVVLAGEYTGLITEYSAKKITFKARVKGEKKGVEKNLTVGKDVKITKDDDAVTDLADQVKTASTAEKGPKGVFAKITTKGEGDDEYVNKIELVKRKGKKKDKTDK
jgi:hypothetical protein